MGGSSDREKASQGFYDQVEGMDTSANNRFNTFRNPYSAQDKLKSVDDYTEKGIKSLKDIREKTVAREGQAAASNAQSRGFGGSILQDTIAKARAKAGGGTNNAINQLMMKRLALTPQIMSQENQDQFNITQGAQNVDLQNLMNIFRKLGLQSGAIQGLSDDTWLDDVFAGINTGANVADAFIPG